MEHRAVRENRVASCCPTIALSFRKGRCNEENHKMVARECNWLSQRDTEKKHTQEMRPTIATGKTTKVQGEGCGNGTNWILQNFLALERSHGWQLSRALPPVSCTGEHNESDRRKENAGKERMKTRHQMHGKLGTMTDLELINMRHAMTKGCSHPFVWVLLLAVWLFCLCDHCSPICFSIFFTTAIFAYTYLPGFLH